MKRAFSIVLALTLVLALAGTAAAASDPEDPFTAVATRRVRPKGL